MRTITILLLSTLTASAHTAPSGWQYPFECCSNHDCREIPGTAVEIRPEGYFIPANGDLIPWNDHRVKGSPDGRYHICTWGGKPEAPTICLFIPSGS